jgi:hypothetical protein
MDVIVPIVLGLVVLVVAWVVYDSQFGYRRQLNSIRKHHGEEVSREIEIEAQRLIGDGWRANQAYMQAMETVMKATGLLVRGESEARVRTSSHRAVTAHDEHAKKQQEARARLLVKHSEGIIPGQGPAHHTPTPPPEPKQVKKK